VKTFYCSLLCVLNRGSAAACLLAGIVVLNPADNMDVFSASDRSLVQMSPTVCVVSECDCESSIMKRPWPNRGSCTMDKRSAVLT